MALVTLLTYPVSMLPLNMILHIHKHKKVDIDKVGFKFSVFNQLIYYTFDVFF